MKRNRRHSTNILYAVIWAFVILLYILNQTMEEYSDRHEISYLAIALRMCTTLAPFMLLFLVNNYLLIPRFLLPGKLRTYLWYAVLAMILALAYQYADFRVIMAKESLMPPPGPPFRHPHRLLPLPLLLSFVYDILVIGGNVAIALTLQRFDDRLDRERLLKINAENELSYLKAQISPHFYMNMLNNIHGMIEIDGPGAQEMVLDMSKLMRYMLYDSAMPSISLDKEIEFMNTYLGIMRRRYPESKVEISASFPDSGNVRDISIPPLLFLVFIENAFKHGISYQAKSFVRINLKVADGRINFNIRNSLSAAEKNASKAGIGLKNISQRLELLYHGEARLDIQETENTYSIDLSLPIYETAHSGNRR